MSSLFLGLAILVALLSAISLYRVIVGPTVFDRALGAGLIGTNALLLLLILLFIAVANPTATHAISRAALQSGLEIWTRKGEPEA